MTPKQAAEALVTLSHQPGDADHPWRIDVAGRHSWYHSRREDAEGFAHNLRSILVTALTHCDRLEALPERERGFIFALCANASDFPTALVFADWLDEHGRTAEGARVRRLVPKAGELLVGTTAPEDPEESACADAESPEHQLMVALFDAVRSACPDGGPSVVVLPHGAELNTLGEEEMRRLGWVRAERAAEARAAERERCRAVLRERMEHVCRFADEIAPVNPSAARFAAVEVVALRHAINLLSDQAALALADDNPDVSPAGSEGATP